MLPRRLSLQPPKNKSGQKRLDSLLFSLSHQPYCHSSMTETELDPQQKNLWLKGVSAYQLKNLDYSINLILAVVKQVPDFLEGRKMLRRAEIEKVRTTKKSMFGGGLSLGG